MINCYVQALHMMNRSVSGGGPMSQQPGALENVKYMTTRYHIYQSSSGTNRFPGVDLKVRTGFQSLLGALTLACDVC